MRPSGDTNDAEQPPIDTTAASGACVGSASAAGSICAPSLRSASAFSGICDGIHMPPGLSHFCGAGAAGAVAVGAFDAVPPQAAKSAAVRMRGTDFMPGNLQLRDPPVNLGT